MSDSNIGARKKHNVRNHLFIVNGIVNNVMKSKTKCVEIQVFDLVMAFDSLWMEESLNDLYDNTDDSLRNDKLALVADLNKESLVAIKTPVGLTDRINITDIVQQGGTWGPVTCSNTIDKVGKDAKKDEELLYQYKDVVEVMPLSMVDDLLAVSECGEKAVILNAYINSKVEMKKLSFHTTNDKGLSKCRKIHIGKCKVNCPDLKVHETKMPDVEEQLYLGNIISADGKNILNISSRVSKGVGIISTIFDIIKRIWNGHHYVKTALLLRDSMLINGVLTNLEVMYDVSKADLKELSKLDKLFFQKLTESARSTPTESCFLEFSVLPIEMVLKGRRVNYFHYLVSQNPSVMLLNFFRIQWVDPVPGDWTMMVKKELIDLGKHLNITEIKVMSKESFKNLVKKKLTTLTFGELMEKKNKHSKMNKINYNKFEIQTYLMNPKINKNQIKEIYKFRTHMLPNFKENFKGSEEEIPCSLCI